MTDPSESEQQLDSKVSDWLDHEGYPLEFAVANAFQKGGFPIRQGSYVRNKDSECPREIDVLAYLDDYSDERLTRINNVVECKWSKDKPWVVFTNSHGMMPTACAAQTISSLLGSALLWKEAGHIELSQSALFARPQRSGFSGRQSLTKGQDTFYNAMKSVTSLARLSVEDYDSPKRKKGVLPECAVVAFPVIVVDGILYEAFFDEPTGKMSLERKDKVRCFWKGAPDWPLHATVDVVTFDGLLPFIEQRKKDCDVLMGRMLKARMEVEECFRAKSIASLKITEGPRGVVGLHQLFRELPQPKALPAPNEKKQKPG